MKRIALMVCLVGAFLVSVASVPLYAAEVDVLINKLVEKGVLSREEAGQLLNEMYKEGVRQETTVKETAEKVAKETAEKAVKEGAQTWAKTPDWVNRFHFKGDFRARYQYENKEKSDGPDHERNRGRYRWRLGAVADVTEDKKWQVGFGLASGGDDPRSTNQTFTNDFETNDARIDYAYGQFQPFKEWKIIAGQFKNPLYQAKDLVWDGDIRPQGVASPLNFKINDQFGFFVTPALFVLQEFDSKEENALMFALQPGVTINPTKSSWIKLAGIWYCNTDVEGNSFEHAAGTNSTDAEGNLLDDYTSLGLDGEVGLKFNSYIQHAALFGQFIKSDADNDDTGWLAGLKFGRKVKDLGDWELKYNYRHLEKDAVLDFLPDSDFYGGDTGVEGNEVELKFGLAKHVYLALDYYRAQQIDGPENDEDLFQFDFNFEF
jgi:polyhydroxyalkanoate synthesis regulator phasin